MDLIALALALVAGLAYFRGSRHPSARRPPLGRGASAFFYSGLVALAIAFGPPIDGLAGRSFAVHMVQHVLLVLIAPPLLALGAPVSMLLRTTGPRARGLIARFLRSPLARVLANPIVGWVLLVGVTFGIHMSPVFDLALRSSPVHALEHAAWITSALIYWWPIVGRDPSPYRISYPVRLLSLLLFMPVMSFLALSIYSAPVALYPTYATVEPWGGGVVADQQAAAVVMWLVGNLLVVLAMLLVAVAWKHHDEALAED